MYISIDEVTHQTYVLQQSRYCNPLFSVIMFYENFMGPNAS